MGHSAPQIASNEGVAATLSTTLGSMLLGAQEAYGEITLVVKREAVADALALLRDHHSYQQLVEMAGVDYPERPERFEVCYHLLSLTANHRIRIKISTDEDTPVPSVTSLWPNAGWLEREVFDMYGVLFDGNPDLRRILTDYGFKGHPFRKDFPLTGYVEMRYSEEQGRVVYEPVKLAQDFRSFDFMSPWEGADYILPGDEKVERGPPTVDKPKTTEKQGDSGAGPKANAKAEISRSADAPAVKDSDVERPTPDKTKAGHDKSNRGKS